MRPRRAVLAGIRKRARLHMRALERFFEQMLWRSRLLVVVAVISGAVLAAGTVYMATVDVVLLLGKLAQYASPALDATGRAALREDLIAGTVKAVDAYLIAAILLIFALGLYELFIDRIDPSETAARMVPHLLQIASVDDLKDRIAKLVLLVIIIEFFVYALKVKYATPPDLLYLAVGVLFIGGALYLSGPGGLRGRQG
jgi:uncharacterized membrane protein YqhA